MRVKEIRNNDFDSIKNGKGVFLVDCYATWCGPCRMLSPIIDSLSDEIDYIEFYKMDTDNNEKIAYDHRIMSIPTLLIYKNGELQEKIVGFRNREELKEVLDRYK